MATTRTKQFVINLPSLSGIKPRDPLFTQLATGAYKVKIADAEQSTKDDGGMSLSLTCEVVDGESAGSTVYANLGLDLAKKGNLRSWVGLLMSLGATEQQLAAGLQIQPGSLVGKTGCIYVKAAPEGEQNARPDVNFITREQFAQILATAQTHGAAAGHAQVGSAIPQPVVAPAIPQPVAAQPPAFGGAPVPNGAAGAQFVIPGAPPAQAGGALPFP